MKFTELTIPGAYLIELEKLEDERGFFARSWCLFEFRKHGLETDLVQCNVSFNHKAGTVRGMHFQAAPNEEAKVVRCTRGRIYDVLVDIRADSAMFKRWQALELSAENHCMLYIPKGVAHGFQTLEDDSEVFYQMSTFYAPQSASGYRWNDPAFGIEWPLEEITISEKDRAYEDFNG